MLEQILDTLHAFQDRSDYCNYSGKLPINRYIHKVFLHMIERGHNTLSLYHQDHVAK